MAVWFILMKAWVLPRHQQAEINDPDDAKYLATSVDLNWVYTAENGMQRVRTADIPSDAIAREDL